MGADGAGVSSLFDDHQFLTFADSRRRGPLRLKFPDRFLFGTDEVAPTSQQGYLKVFYQYEPLWKLLTPEASEKVRKGNFARLFDEARPKVRAWEAAHKTPSQTTSESGAHISVEQQ